MNLGIRIRSLEYTYRLCPQIWESTLSSGHRVQALSLKDVICIHKTHLYHSHTWDQFQENNKKAAFLTTCPVSLHRATEEQKPSLCTIKQWSRKYSNSILTCLKE